MPSASRLAFLLLVVAACDPYVATAPAPVEECEAEPAEPIQLGADCWDDPTCTLDTITEETCGRAYRCPIAQVDGSYKDVCVVAVDCDCRDDLEACGVDVDDLPHCEF